MRIDNHIAGGPRMNSATPAGSNMALIGPWIDPATPKIEQEGCTMTRNDFLVGAHPDTDDELDEESMSSQVNKNKDSLKGGDDKHEDELDDIDKDILEGLDEDEGKGEEGEEKSDDRDEDLDEEELTYKKRYGDLRTDQQRKAEEIRRLMQENAALREKAQKASGQSDVDLDEESLAREVQDGIYREVTAITETDPAKRTKAAYEIIGKHIAHNTAKAVKLTLEKVRQQQQADRDLTVQEQQQLEVVKKRARIALKELKLDPDKHFPHFEKEVQRITAEEPEWFDAIPKDQHFMRVAERIKERVERIREQRAKQQKEAGGQINEGGRPPRRSSRNEEDGDEAETLSSAMSLLGRSNKARGQRAFQVAHLHRQ